MILGKLIYIFATISLSLGLFMIISNHHYTRKIIGLMIFQNSVLVFYIAIAKIRKGIIPIYQCSTDKIIKNCEYVVYTSPVPHVLMLTAIVVGFATTAVALSLICSIQEEFGSCDEKEILKNFSD